MKVHSITQGMKESDKKQMRIKEPRDWAQRKNTIILGWEGQRA